MLSSQEAIGVISQPISFGQLPVGCELVLSTSKQRGGCLLYFVRVECLTEGGNARAYLYGVDDAIPVRSLQARIPEKPTDIVTIMGSCEGVDGDFGQASGIVQHVVQPGLSLWYLQPTKVYPATGDIKEAVEGVTPPVERVGLLNV